MKREGRHIGSRNPGYDYSSEAPAKSFGPVVWEKCNACSYTFKRQADGSIDMKDFRQHKAEHDIDGARQKRYSQKA